MMSAVRQSYSFASLYCFIIHERVINILKLRNVATKIVILYQDFPDS